MLLKDFVSNDTVKNELEEIMKSGKLPHAVIIDGERGTGKKTLAMIIAQYCVCSADCKNPCNICSDCVKFLHGSHPDIFVADSNDLGTLNIESIRNIRSSAYIKPNEAKRKVYILLNCDRMLPPAQNAFLKVLEEPPENVVFIMTCISATSLLQTVRSRSRIFSLFPAEHSLAVNVVKEKFPDKDYNEIEHIVSICGGNIGLSLQILENGGDEEAKRLAADIFRAIMQKNEYQLMLLTNQLTSSRGFAVNVIDCMLEIAAEAIKASVGAKTVSGNAVEIATKISGKKLLVIMDNIKKAHDILNINVNMNLFGIWLCSMLKV